LATILYRQLIKVEIKDITLNKLEKFLNKYFGFSKFRSNQQEIIKHILDKKNALVLMATGGGKSICFQLPALIFENQTIVVSPLIALMQDQVNQLKKKNIPVNCIHSNQTPQKRKMILEEFLRGKIKLLYVSAERLTQKSFQATISKIKIDLLAVDEAHCISQWGHDFRPNYMLLKEFRKLVGSPPVIALTATATPVIQQEIMSNLLDNHEKMKVYNSGIYRDNLTIRVEEVFSESDKFEEIFDIIIQQKKIPTIIYFNLITSLRKFSDFLDNQEITYSCYHGKMNAKERSFMSKKFSERKTSLVLATNAFGMGIDRDDIRHIIHADLPDSVESFFQEIGRAGRDGKTAYTTLFFRQEDLALLMDFLQFKNPQPDFIKQVYDYLKKNPMQLASMRYEDLQEAIVHKNRGDHRLSTVLGLFDRYGVTLGQIEMGTLKLVNELPISLADVSRYEKKLGKDQLRLANMVKLIRTSQCRMNYIYEYFGVKPSDCKNKEFCKCKLI